MQPQPSAAPWGGTDQVSPSNVNVPFKCPYAAEQFCCRSP